MEQLDKSCYALPALNKFPIHTAEDTLGSYGAYSMQKKAFSDSQRAEIEANFTKAAAYYEIELPKEAEKPVKQATLMFKGASEAVNMSEIDSREALDEAVNFILTKRASVKRENLAEPAKYVLWNAANSNIDIDTDTFRKIAHIAGIGVGDREAIQHEFEKRATLIPLARESEKEFWKYANELKSLSDEAFYSEKNLNTVCNVLDNMDFMYNNQHKHASELGYPEDVVFANTLGDLCKQASDLYYIKSIDATLSKKATLERKDAVNGFFSKYFGMKEPMDGDALINKVASLDANTANALIETIE